MSGYVEQLIVRRGRAVEQIVTLDHTRVTIGRANDNELRLLDDTVSRYHAVVAPASLGAAVVDIGSSQGTYVDGQRLAHDQEFVLTSGRSFEIGPYLLTYWSPGRPWRAAASGYLLDLPTIFQENDFLGRFLLGLETVWEPLEQRQDHLAMYLNPRTCPAPFLPWLLGWFGLSLEASWPEARARIVLANVSEIIRERGTPDGLRLLIESYTGATVAIVEDAGQPLVFRVRVMPQVGQSLDPGAVERLIQAHKPAHAGYVLEMVT
jgi:phage tail-like protein